MKMLFGVVVDYASVDVGIRRCAGVCVRARACWGGGAEHLQ